MLGLKTHGCAPLLSVSVIALAAAVGITAVHAQSAPPVEQGAKDTRQKQKQAKRKRAGAPMAEVPLPRDPMNANAQIGQPVYQPLDEITVAASKTEERAIDALAPVSVVTLEQIRAAGHPRRRHDQHHARCLAAGSRRRPVDLDQHPRLQDFGRRRLHRRGARQNYQRTGHFANARSSSIPS